MAITQETLRVVTEPTRIRILRLCSKDKLTTNDLVSILDETKAKVAWHLSTLIKSGFLKKRKIGQDIFFVIDQEDLVYKVLAFFEDFDSANDPIFQRDLERLSEVHFERETRNHQRLEKHIRAWDKSQQFHVDRKLVEEELIKIVLDDSVDNLLDIGTGTGRILELLGSYVKSGIGVDLSEEMIAKAKATLTEKNLLNCYAQKGDMYNLPFSDAQFDAVTFHMVLHYALKPLDALQEAVRVLRPKGRLILVDFEPHGVQELQDKFSHRWLGFSHHYMQRVFKKVGLEPSPVMRLEGGDITVNIWCATKTAASVSDENQITQTAS